MLLGAILRVGDRAGRIVEVEAYEGANDPASHAATGPTRRNAVMFGAAARLYVYRIYGMHWCANVTSGAVGEPGAVLIRAIEPVDGTEQMWPARPKARTETDLGSGPGKLCAALGITGDHDGVDLRDSGSPVCLDRPTTKVSAVVRGPRIGITKAVDYPWRFAEADNPHVSRPRNTLGP